MGAKKRSWMAPTPWDGQKGFWATLNRIVYQVEGPAQVGTLKPEEPYQPPADPDCPICGAPMSRHAVDRSGVRTFVRCP